MVSKLNIFIGIIMGLGIVMIISCNDPRPLASGGDINLMEIPIGFPNVDFPEDNAFTEIRWKLGKKLFYEKALSIDSTLSCGSCHKQALAFADQVALTDGVKGRSGVRNVPSLANVAYHPYLIREGSVPTLEMQVLVPIQEHNEFAFNIVLIAERLSKDSSYAMMSREAYERPMDHFVITRALACFERSLLSGNSRYDQVAFQGNNQALSKDEKAGMELFFSSRAGCSSCHGGFNFTQYSFENNGLYEVYPDSGRFRFTKDLNDIGKFKVPSLRNVQLTAPYMYDGSLNTLEEVVEHYQSGGKTHANKSDKISPLPLTENEKQQLVAFLNSLTDIEFVDNPNFREE